MKADMKCDEARDEFEPGNDRLGVEEKIYVFVAVQLSYMFLLPFNFPASEWMLYLVFSTSPSMVL